MTQTRLRNYLNPLTSFDHNKANLGMHNPGRYAGFDTVQWAALNSLSFLIAHTGTGITYKDANENVVGPSGVLLTPQGGIIFDGAPVGTDTGTVLTLDSNAGNTNIRYDILVCSHSFVVEAGGQNALYSIVKGSTSSPTIPSVTDPLHQIIVGVFKIQPGATGSNGTIRWIPSECPDSGDGKDARLELINTFNQLQQWNTSSTNYTAGTTTYSNYGGTGITGMGISLNTDGNTFRIIPSSGGAFNLAALLFDGVTIQDGTRISLVVNQYLKTIFNSTVALTSGDYTKGYRAIMGNITFQTGTPLGTSNQIVPVASATWELQLRYDINKSTAGGQTGAWIIVGIGMMDDPTKFTPVVPPTPPNYPWVPAAFTATIDNSQVQTPGTATVTSASGSYQIINRRALTYGFTIVLAVSATGMFNINIPTPSGAPTQAFNLFGTGTSAWGSVSAYGTVTGTGKLNSNNAACLEPTMSPGAFAITVSVANVENVTIVGQITYEIDDTNPVP